MFASTYGNLRSQKHFVFSEIPDVRKHCVPTVAFPTDVNIASLLLHSRRTQTLRPCYGIPDGRKHCVPAVAFPTDASIASLRLFLFTAYCLLLTEYCILLTAYCSLIT